MIKDLRVYYFNRYCNLIKNNKLIYLIGIFHILIIFYFHIFILLIFFIKKKFILNMSFLIFYGIVGIHILFFRECILCYIPKKVIDKNYKLYDTPYCPDIDFWFNKLFNYKFKKAYSNQFNYLNVYIIYIIVLFITPHIGLIIKLIIFIIFIIIVGLIHYKSNKYIHTI